MALMQILPIYMAPHGYATIVIANSKPLKQLTSVYEWYYMRYNAKIKHWVDWMYDYDVYHPTHFVYDISLRIGIEGAEDYGKKAFRQWIERQPTNAWWKQ